MFAANVPREEILLIKVLTLFSQPTSIEEFLRMHDLGHLRHVFVNNGIDLEFAQELTFDEMEEFGISSARDRIKLKRALKTLRA